MDYNFLEIEKKWQDYWSANKTFKAEIDHSKPKYYVLDMFPYPSGAGLHVGHPLGYIASDIYARYMRHLGYNVLHPMGYDAYGLPAEQYAIQSGTHPEITTFKNIDRYREQLDKIGFSFDWDREVRTCDPSYYKWTQWTFIQLFNSWYNTKSDKAESIDLLIQEFEKNGNKNVEAASEIAEKFSATQWQAMSEKEQQDILMRYRLAYISETFVNWCPELGTVLANDEVKDGLSERGGHPVERKLMKQWSLRVSAYAQRLLDGLDKVDWPDSLKEIQRNWIGRSEGAVIKFNLTPALSKGEGAKPNSATSPDEDRVESDSQTVFEERRVKPGYMTTDSQMWSVLKEKARDARKKPTAAEAVIWQRLRAKQIGHRIRRQHAIDRFIVDFVCLRKKTIIEIDGKIHEKQKSEDAERTEILKRLGYSVIRFSNEQIVANVDEVIEEIKDYLDNKVLPFTTENNTFLPFGEDKGGVVEVFTTRPDTIFGATYMVLAPEHELVSQITTSDRKKAVDAYIEMTKNRSERERLAEVKKISGEFTGAYAINPFSGKKIPIWVADYVLAGYGSGAIMAVPAHDSRDYAFARHFNLPVIPVVSGGDISENSYDAKEGKMINSDFLNGMEVKQAITAAIKKTEEINAGYGTVNYRLRDAIFSRQRYWGEPFPIYYKEGIACAMEEDKLPLLLPEVDKYLPTETGEPPLARAKNWATDEGYPIDTNTMPGFAGSNAYYLRFMDPKNEKEFFSKEANTYWKNVDLYIGGDEHGAGHLIYSRFCNKFLFDIGLVCEEEPFKKLINQGKIQGRSNFVYRIKGTNTFVSYGLRKQYETSPLHVDINIVDNDILNTEAFKKWRPEFANAEFILENGKYVCGFEVEKMSKSKHNVQNPDELIEKYGADTLRLYEMFLGPLESHKPWDTKGIEGVFRFLKKLWRLYHDQNNNFTVSDTEPDKQELKIIHKTIKKIREDIERFSFNTAVSAFMICVNELGELKCNKRAVLTNLIKLLSPFAPHMAEEIWQLLGNTTTISYTKYPDYKEEYIQEDEYAYPVSFNGKMRCKINLSVSLSKEEIEKAALAAEEIQKWLQDKTPKKVIVVPKKIINIVI